MLDFSEKIDPGSESPFFEEILSGMPWGKAMEEIIDMTSDNIQIGMNDKKVISINSKESLVTTGVSNCKAIVLVYKNTSTNEVFYSLEHAGPDKSPNLNIPDECALLEKYWIDGPEKHMRMGYLEGNHARIFQELETSSDSSMKIKVHYDPGEEKYHFINVTVDPQINTIYISYCRRLG